MVEPNKPKQVVELLNYFDDTIAIGIDLGTTMSCVAIWKPAKNDAEIIKNESGNTITPSVVAFTPEQILVGPAAINQINKNAKNTITEAKRFIGRDFNEPEVQELIKTLPFKVVEGERHEARICIQLKGKEEQQFIPEEISSHVLIKMRKIAEEKMNGKKIRNAVITVPAYFNHLQRQATMDAGKIAGLNVLRIVNEPTAAAIAYGFEKKQEAGARNCLIYDLGGGTFDVTILRIEGGDFKVLATNGDMFLGGEDFDKIVTKYCQEEFKKAFDIDISNNTKALRKLSTASQKGKKLLSESIKTDIEVDDLAGEEDCSVPISRAKFEAMCDPLFQRTIPVVEKVLTDAKLQPDEIHDIVMVGGSTRIPIVRELISQFFGGRQLIHELDPDEAIAKGAAILAANLIARQNPEEFKHDDPGNQITEVKLTDVTPISLGIEADEGKMEVMIPSNTPIPAAFTKSFFTSVDNQAGIMFQVHEGESKLANENAMIAKFILRGIPKKPAGQVEVQVTFQIDENSILSISAKNTDTAVEENITIENSGKLTPEQMEKMKIAAVKAEIQDQQIALSANFKNLSDKAELTGETIPQSEIDAYDVAHTELQAKYDAL